MHQQKNSTTLLVKINHLSYSIHLSFGETSKLQFDNDGPLIYDLPGEIGANGHTGELTIVLKIGTERYEIEGNSYRIENNQLIFNRRNSALEFKHGKSYKTLKRYEKEAELVPYMLLHLHTVFKEITIINPYVYFVINFLKDSAFYKRDFEKFNGLLKTITALNFYKHEVYDIDGKKVILTSIEDVQLFMSLLKPYKESISANVSPKAVDVLNDIRNNIEKWKLNGEREVLGLGITTNEYFNLQNLGLD